MDYKIVKKETFTILGISRDFAYENAKQEIPLFWEEHYSSGKRKYVCGMFGITIESDIGLKTGNEKFEYLIADAYNPSVDIPDGFEVKTIPAFTWALFPCKGALPHSLQDVNTKIFSEWLPALQDYECAAGYCVEMYDDSSKYPNGTKDENYYSEM